MSRRFRQPTLIASELAVLGHRLRYARQCRGLSRGLVSKYIAVPVPTLKHYERGARSTPQELVRLCAYLYDVPIAWLYWGEGEPPCKPMSDATKMWKRFGRRCLEKGFRERWRARPNYAELPR